MDCGVPFCQAGVRDQGAWLGCPLHNRGPEWNDMLWRGNGSQALSRLLKTNCFPEFTGRVCPASCEKACACGTFGQPVTIRDNEPDIIEEAFARGGLGPCPPDKRSGKTVAVVGSGPVGLAAVIPLSRPEITPPVTNTYFVSIFIILSLSVRPLALKAVFSCDLGCADGVNPAQTGFAVSLLVPRAQQLAQAGPGEVSQTVAA